MYERYSDKMIRLENQYRSWMLKADQLFEENQFQPSKEQCRCLQQAAACQSEMAQISIGSEREHHLMQTKEINSKIAQIVQILDPEYYRRKEEEARGKLKNSSSKEKPSSASGSAKVDDEEVKGWFQEIPSHSFEDVVGMEEVKEKLRHCVKSASLQALYTRMKIRKQQSYFFVGPPGCGKTFIIRAFAHELAKNQDYRFLSLVGSDILSKYVGDAEKTITRLFEEAEKNAPCIVFIDEIDGVCKSRSLPGLPEYASSLTTSFLTGYNRINESDKPVLFIGATNYPSQVDSAMRDRVEQIYIPYPDGEARAMKFRQELGGIVELEPEFTYEDMSDLVVDEKTWVNYRDIVRLCNQIKMSLVDIAMERFTTEEEAIAALDRGEIRLTRELFAKAHSSYIQANGKSRAREQQAWEEELKGSMEQ